MIITWSPLRGSRGGGTGLPAYDREHSGFVIAAAIDKYAPPEGERGGVRGRVARETRDRESSAPGQGAWEG